MLRNNPMRDPKVVRKVIATKRRTGVFKRISNNMKKEKNLMWKTGRHAYRRIIIEERVPIFKCHICNSTKKLEIHHVDGNRDNNQIENLIFVCRTCHMKLDGRMSNRNELGQFIQKENGIRTIL